MRPAHDGPFRIEVAMGRRTEIVSGYSALAGGWLAPARSLAAVHPAWNVPLLVAFGALSIALIAGSLVAVARMRHNARRLRKDLESELAERKKAEEALGKSEAFYHLLVETLPQNILRKDADGLFTFANRKFCESLGQSSDAIIGQTDQAFYPAELAETYRADDRRVMESNTPFETTEEHVGPDAESKYMHIIKTPIHDPAGAVIGTQCIFWDVTSEKRTELALRKTRERYEVAVQGSKDGLWDWDLETNEVYFSPQWKAMIGFQDHEFPNEYEAWYARMHPDDRDRADATIGLYLDGRATDYVLEHRLRHKGRLVPLDPRPRRRPAPRRWFTLPLRRLAHRYHGPQERRAPAPRAE